MLGSWPATTRSSSGPARHPTADRAVPARPRSTTSTSGPTASRRSTRADRRRADLGGDEHGRVVYAVPGSPLVLERSVRNCCDVDGRRRSRPGGRTPARRCRSSTRPGPGSGSTRSTTGSAWSTVTGSPWRPPTSGDPLLVAHAHAPWVLSEIKLAIDAGPEQRAIVLQGLGTAEERVDRGGRGPTSIGPGRGRPPDLPLPARGDGPGRPRAGPERRDDGLASAGSAPGTGPRTHQSLRRFLIEEAYEVVDVPSIVCGAVGPVWPWRRQRR